MAPWIGIIVPIKTPKEIVARLSQETLAVMRDPEVIKLLTEQQVTPMATGPEEFEALIKTGPGALVERRQDRGHQSRVTSGSWRC